MKRYEIVVTETTGTYVVVEANDEKEAKKMFNDWLCTSNGVEYICYRLSKNGGEWDISDPVETNETADLLYDEIQKDIREENIT